MPAINNFKELSLLPVWENRQYYKNEYTEIIENLASKGNHSLMVEDHSLVLTGTFSRIWQAIKGFFGFENQTDPIKVNYELLRLWRYGEKHHYLDDGRIRKAMQNLQKVLAKEKNHSEIAEIVGKALSTSSKTSLKQLDDQISKYAADKRTQLDEAFWPRLFHHYISPIRMDNALLQYNYGLVSASKKDYESAVKHLEKAIKIADGHEKEWHKSADPEWIYHLAACQCTLAEQLENKNDKKRSKEIYEQAWQVIQRLSPSEKDAFGREVLALRKNLFNRNLRNACHNLGLTGAYSSLQREARKEKKSFEEMLQSFIESDPSSTEFHAMLYRALAHSPANYYKQNDEDYCLHLFKLAIEKFKTLPNGLVSPVYLQTNLDLFHAHWIRGNFTDAEKVYQEVIKIGKEVIKKEVIKIEKEASPKLENLINQIKTATLSLANHQIATHRYQDACDLAAEYSKIFGDDPAVQAKAYYASAKKDQSNGAFKDALSSVRSAVKLEKNVEYITLSLYLTEALTGEAAEQIQQAATAIKLNEFEKAIQIYKKLFEDNSDNGVYRQAILDTCLAAGKRLESDKERAAAFFKIGEDITKNPSFLPFNE